jgi:hypothetical protein
VLKGDHAKKGSGLAPTASIPHAASGNSRTCRVESIAIDDAIAELSPGGEALSRGGRFVAVARGAVDSPKLEVLEQGGDEVDGGVAASDVKPRYPSRTSVEPVAYTRPDGCSRLRIRCLGAADRSSLSISDVTPSRSSGAAMSCGSAELSAFAVAGWWETAAVDPFMLAAFPKALCLAASYSAE